MASYGDLNIALLNNPRETELLVRKAVDLGYETIALNTNRELNSTKKRKEKQAPLCIPPNLKRLVENTKKATKLLSRVTVKLDDQCQLHQLATPPFSTCDILAVNPTTEKLFQQCCSTLEVDIISLDITSRLPFYLKVPQVKQAVQRGIYFEIVYSPAIRGTSQRKYIISNALEIVQATKGNNTLLSSQAESVMDIRGPYDVANLGQLFGLKEEQCKAAVSRNVRGLVYHAYGRKSVLKSAIVGYHVDDEQMDGRKEMGSKNNGGKKGPQPSKKIKLS